jgi:hypothetical protein
MINEFKKKQIMGKALRGVKSPVVPSNVKPVKMPMPVKPTMKAPVPGKFATPPQTKPVHMPYVMPKTTSPKIKGPVQLTQPSKNALTEQKKSVVSLALAKQLK